MISVGIVSRCQSHRPEGYVPTARGGALTETGTIHQSSADYMGMLGTVINGVALHEAIENLCHSAHLMSALAIPAVAEPFIRALRYFD